MRVMKNIFFIGLILTLIFNGCNTVDTEIQRSEVTKDAKTHLWKYNRSGWKVTGTIVADTLINGKSCIMKIVVEKGLTQSHKIQSNNKLVEKASYANGLLEGELKKYHPNNIISYSASYKKGKLNGELKQFNPDSTIKYSAFYKNGILDGPYTQYKNGIHESSIFYKKGKKESQNFYSPSGKLIRMESYRNGKKHGIEVIYNKNGDKIKENVYEFGKITESFDIDEYGERIIFKLVDYTSGYYKDINSNGEILYKPMVIMKWKNVSKTPLNGKIEIKGEFFTDDEELCEILDYLQNSSQQPLQPGKIRQTCLKSYIGYKYAAGVAQGNISCNISINGQHYKTIRIKNTFLSSNRI
mgnify:CR=1 FL=1